MEAYVLTSSLQPNENLLSRCPKVEADLVELVSESERPEEGAQRSLVEAFDNCPTTLAPNQVLKGTGFRMRRSENFFLRRDLPPDIFELFPDFWVEDLLARAEGLQAPVASISLNIQDVNRWQMAWRAFQLYENLDLMKAWDRPLVQRSRNWPGMDKIFTFPVGLGFSFAAAIYGGLHALAWKAHFISLPEQTLWRVSSCVVMGGCPVILAWNASLYKLGDWEDMGGLVQRVVRITFYPLVGLYVLLILAYILARAYLVIEGFINLSHLPNGVYDVPNWSAYFPHIS